MIYLLFKTDEGFFKAQDKIKTVLENEHYPSFIVTELYEKALEQIEDDGKHKNRHMLIHYKFY